MPSKVVHNGSVLKEDELKEKFYPVWDYNQALKKAIIEGAEGGWYALHKRIIDFSLVLTRLTVHSKIHRRTGF
ncbi:hypothetical protein HRED_10709 [Candidatus Haloredivivus sp. G17]|nr:hypothetical protein HRED_10709 [Candidatus Haloredivivus sp. G17]